MARGKKFSRPVTVTGAPAIRNDVRAHCRAMLCCSRPSSSTHEAASEIHPKNAVKKKNKGLRTRLELNRPASDKVAGVPGVVLIPRAAPQAPAGNPSAAGALVQPGKASRSQRLSRLLE